jgi:DNA-binding GntR family transcriptional regulator
VRQAAGRMSAADRRRLTATLSEFGRLLRSGRKKPVLERGQDFHMIVLEASGNRALAEVGRAVLDRIWVIQNINLLTADHLADAHPEHVGILAALKRGDGEAAAALMRRHLGLAKDFVLSRLRNSEDILSRMTRGTSLSNPHS